jgi:serine protease Do
VGSGAIITKDGYVVTNHHVAGHGARIFCTLWNREEIEADLVGTDPLTDISVLKLKPPKPRKFATASFGDSSKMRVGDPVLAMGSPMALSQSVTLGIVSNTEMMMPRFFGPSARFRLDGEDVGGLVRWIGHDAPIYGGNSGGPLSTCGGEIIGINEISSAWRRDPRQLAKSVADQLMAHGKIQRSWWAWTSNCCSNARRTNMGCWSAALSKILPPTWPGSKPATCFCVWRIRRLYSYDEQLPDFMRSFPV